MVCPWRQKNEIFVDRDVVSEGVDGYVYVFVGNPGKTIVRLREDRYRVDKLLNRMKIAVPTRDGAVDNHFGHCAYFTVFTVNDQKQITGRETLPAPQGCGCKSGIASVLHEMGVEVMLAGNMGDGAVNVLARNGIVAIRGCVGEIERLVEAYLAGRITDSGQGCAAHHEGEACHHHTL